MKVNAYLEITMKIDEANRPAAAKVYTDYRGPFLETIEGALTKDLLIRGEDVYKRQTRLPAAEALAWAAATTSASRR